MSHVDQALYGTTVIPYRIEWRDRKTLAIEVHPDGTVLVKAPEAAALEAIRARVSKRGGWITRQQQDFLSYPPPLPARSFVSGEAYRYLGRQYRLKVSQGDSERVRLWRGRLEVTTRDPDYRARVGRQVIGWFRGRAQAVFDERYLACSAYARQHGIAHDLGFDLVVMSKRWGSCSRSGRLLLNPALVSAPKAAIDYVILHELCHTVVHDHSERFYRLLTRLLPDWQERRRQLNTVVEVLDLATL